MRDFLRSVRDYYAPPPVEARVAQILRIIGDVFYDFGLYSDKRSRFGSYQIAILPRTQPLIAGGFLKIQINTALLPRGVLLVDLQSPTLLTALRSALDTNVEIKIETGAPVDHSSSSEMVTRPTQRVSSGWLPWSRSQTEIIPERYNMWIRVELDTERLRGIPRLVQLDDLPPPDESHRLSWPLGIIQGDLAYLADFPEEIITMFVCGATRMGKSTHIRAGLKYLYTHYDSSYFSLFVADFKDDKTDYQQFMGESNLTFFDKPRELVDFVDKENKRRAAIRRQTGAYNIFEHNDNPDAEFIPYSIVVIDEMYLLNLFATKDEMQKLQTLVATTASNGIYWQIGTQRPGTDVVAGGIKTNFLTRMSFSLPTATDGEVVFGSKTMAEAVVNIGCKGRGFVLVGDRFFEFQSAYA
jgi:hypothetical protein